MGIQKLFFLILILSCSYGCGQRASEVPVVVQNGINGKTYYRISNGKVILAYKEEYAPSWFLIAMNNDTLALGEEFVGHVLPPYGSPCNIEIHAPEMKSFTSDNKSEFFYYRYISREKGAHNFSGKVSCDTLTIEFQYKFFVK